jgi:hypothetical protein
MKNFGSVFEYEQERNRDLMRAYREELANSKFIRMPEIYKAVVDKPSSRFWVSEERAAIVISHMMRGGNIDNMRPLKREMFKVIYQRVMELKRHHPQLPVYQLVFQVVSQRAPKFYLTPGSAKVIICKIKKRWKKERRRNV